MEITALSGSDFDGIQQSEKNALEAPFIGAFSFLDSDFPDAERIGTRTHRP
jgi:hypothetical protein